MDIQDAEYTKFHKDLLGAKVKMTVVTGTATTPGAGWSLEDLEKGKFMPDGSVRVIHVS